MNSTQDTSKPRTTYIAMTDGYWGRGATEEAAVAAVKREGGNTRKGVMLLIRVDEPAEYADKPLPYVDGCGNTVAYAESEVVKRFRNGKPVTI